LPKKKGLDVTTINDGVPEEERGLPNLSPVTKSTLRKALDKKEPRNEIWLPSGSTLLDLVIGAGRGMGHEAGQVINLVSESGAGKTGLCNEAIANAKHRFGDKFKWVYDGTTEKGNTFNSNLLYGFDIIPPGSESRNSKTIQDGFANIMIFLNKLKEDEFGIYVFDSIDALSSDELEDQADARIDAFEKDKEYTKGSYQQEKAKFMSSMFLPQICDEAEKKNCLVILVSQLRDNVGAGMYAAKDRISAGRALLFYCSSRIWLKTKADIEKAGRQIGAVVHATTKKARGPKPYRECMYIFYYEYGIDDVGGNIDFLYDLRTPEKGELSKKAASSIDWDGEEFSRAELINKIEVDKLEEELKRRVIAKWDKQEEEASAEVTCRKKRFS
jgi:RecA/RadA recombinase